MVSRILAFRPANVVGRLAPRSGACPLSARELLGPAVLPVVRAPIAAVARAALVAAKELQAAVGLALPAGVAAGRWFEGVVRAADELAAGFPILLSADVTVEGEGATQVEQACRDAWRLVDVGLSHIAFDVAAVAPPERGRILGEVVQAVAQTGVSVEAVVPLGEGAHVAARAASMLEEVGRRGVAFDAASVRCPAPADGEEARLQAAALARICQALSGVPVMRRGPVTAQLLEMLRGSPVKACDDGGSAAAPALRLVERKDARGEDAPGDLERAAAELPPEALDRVEARAYAEAIDFMERLGARGSALAVSRALEKQLEEG